MNAQKIAQEQMRVFIPTILPTALDFTINLSSLVAMWEAAWTPVLRFVTDEMRQRVIAVYPEIDFMFDENRRNAGRIMRKQPDWTPSFAETRDKFLNKPACSLRYIYDESNSSNFKADCMQQPLDLLHYLPEFMQHNINEVKIEIAISVATMGQDQRHRTVKRGLPKFINAFYCPPLVKNLLQKEDKKLFQTWTHDLKIILPATLHTAIAPYGAMVEYVKVASFNALLHEQAKRLCWCAQEEIYHLSKKLRSQIEKHSHYHRNLLEFLAPPCRNSGKCAEGDRYCGRNINDTKNYFPYRKI